MIILLTKFGNECRELGTQYQRYLYLAWACMVEALVAPGLTAPQCYLS